MSGTRLDQALTYAARGWPVFPCQAGQKIPATAHGHLDATTDPGQITAWFGRHPDWNLAIATGAPGPDVLDVDDHGPAGNGYAAFARLSKASLLDGAARFVRTPHSGLHAYFTGTGQRNGHLPAHHLDFRSRGGYVVAPPSRVDGKPYEVIRTVNADGALNWATVTALLEPIISPAGPSRARIQAGA
jgi:Bifunctional DNA primase/polymerase, N-terminal